MVKNILQVENIIIHHVHFHVYPDDISRLSYNHALLKSSDLRSLMPRLDDKELLVVSGRLKKAKMPLHHKEPYIIPYNSEVAVKIARYYLCMAHHSVEWTLSDIRVRFWITNGRGVAKRVNEACIKCKSLYTSANNQQMANIPRDRTIIGQSPFTKTGCDCFGHYKVQYRRSTLLRYGCVLTCFRTRAIHLEKTWHLGNRFLSELSEKVYC